MSEPVKGPKAHAARWRAYLNDCTAVVGFVEQSLAVRTQDASRFASLVNDGAELFRQPGRGEGNLPVLLVDVELPALSAHIGRGVGLVHRGGDSLNVQYSCQHQAAESCTDDRNGCVHGCLRP